MNAHIGCLNEYVEAMKDQMKLFHPANRRLAEKFQGRMVRVTDAMGLVTQGYFQKFLVTIPDVGTNPMPELFIELLLPKKDGTPSKRIKTVCCNKALFRLLGGMPKTGVRCNMPHTKK